MWRLDDLAPQLRSALTGVLPGSAEVAVIGIDGLGGAGKSTLALLLREHLARSGWATDIVPMDAFYRPEGDRPGRTRETPCKLGNQGGQEALAIGADFDWIRLRDQVLRPFRQGRAVRYQAHDWITHEPGEWVDVDQGVQWLIVEGVYVTRRELRRWYDLTVWLEVPAPLRLARGLERDGPASRWLWEERWMPAEDRYRRLHEPHRRSDVVLDWVSISSESPSPLP